MGFSFEFSLMMTIALLMGVVIVCDVAAQTTPRQNGGSDAGQENVEATISRYASKFQLPSARKMMRTGQLTADDVEYFVSGMKKVQKQLRDDLDVLKQADADDRAIKKLLKRFEGGEFDRLIQQEQESLKRFIDSMVNSGYNHATSAAKLDPESDRYFFNTASVRKLYVDRFQKIIGTLENAGQLEQAMGWEGQWSNKLKEVKQCFETYQQKIAAAAKHNELPPGIENEELEAIARKTLAVKQYGVGEIERLIVASDVAQRSRDELKLQGDSLVRIVRKWQEFQVCTVERENGKYYVYFNDLRRYERAPNPTPVGKWILGNRWKSGEIDSENLR